MKNIVFLNTNHAWGGGEKWHFNSAISFKKRGYNVTVICSPFSKLHELCVSSHLNVINYRTSNLSFLNIFKLIKLAGILRANQTEILFTNLPIDTKLASITKSISGIKKLIYRRGMPHPIKDTTLNRYVFDKVDILVANSDEIKRSLSKNLNDLLEKTQVIYNGVEIPHTHSGKTINHDKIIIGNLGRLVPQKGQSDFIAIAKKLDSLGLNYEIRIGGTGEDKSKLENEISSSNLQDKIKLLGHIDPKKFLEEINIFAFPSRFEGSSNAIIEACSHSLPVIAYNTSSMPELIKDDQTGYLIQPFNTEEFATKIFELSTSKEKYQDLSMKAHQFAAEMFNQKDKFTEIEGLIYGK